MLLSIWLCLHSGDATALILGSAILPPPRRLGATLFHAPRSQPCFDCNVVLISIDTLRADHLGCYGYPRNTSPSIDEFSSESVRFATTITHATSTLRSHASILTSLLPFQHRAIRSKDSPLPPEALTLAEILRDRGYETAAFTGGGQMDPVYGLDQGFNSYVSEPASPLPANVDKAISWLDKNRGKNFFLFLHTYEVHAPYEPQKRFLDLFEENNHSSLPRNISADLIRQINLKLFGVSAVNREDIQRIVNAYDAEIRSVDEAFARFKHYLQDSGLYDRLLIVFLADHGEDFGEHGTVGMHPQSLYDEVLKVPLIIKFPGSAHAAEVIEDQVRTIDVLPTILETLGIDSDGPFQGISLLEWIEGRRKEGLFAFSQRGTLTAPSISIRTQRWKLYDGRLYDLALDPRERRD
ncbi:MAG: sulfatase, partial [Acidobacteriota bacterium]